ncbi:MAG: BadF/BadG/BcrA/BcrD ATPase family protein [Candidatus Electryonea clarkiae]|nr:BadF/BadG/BcrA/BcrD ATPase family protein [Candidatus Electryonea clarkiae]MDP8289101.1 BadF/BadG/BcrA/BcrD ATPase family protein [Candidatus Electryonea clarkiae]
MISASSQILAIDIGATSSKGLLSDFQGEELATAESIGFNLRQCGVDRFQRLYDNLASQLLEQIRGNLAGMEALVIGIAGGGNKESREFIKKSIKSRLPNTKVMIHHDAFIAHYGAFSGGTGVTVTAGTGSIGFGKNDIGVEARSGGWGWMLGDDGSGWWISREAIRAVLATEENGPATALHPAILKAMDITKPYDLLDIIYREKFDRSKITSLSELVSSKAGEGDTIAISILFRAGIELGKLAISVARQLRMPPEKLYVAVLGSVGVGGGKPVQDGIEKALKEYSTEFKHDVKSSDNNNDEDSSSENNPLPTMPEYPPSNLSVEIPPGPACVVPHMDAIHGAVLWARDTLLKQSFA